MSAHGCIAWGQLVLRGEFGERLTTKVDLTENLGVGRLQRRQQLLNATAHDAVSHLVAKTVALAVLFKLGGPTFEGTVFRSTAARLIDDGIA